MPKPTDTGKPKVAPPGSFRKPSKNEERRFKALASHAVKKKHFTDPADCPKKCLYCQNWQHHSGIFGTCLIRTEIRQHFRFCDDFVAQVPQPVTIPQSPDPQGPVDDPNNEILD
jgi:pyruvate-formate lyase-activating enzyme